MITATQMNVTLRYIGPFGFQKPYELLTEALRNTSDPLSSPYIQQAAAGYFSFTNQACLLMTNSKRSTWVLYPHHDIWERIVTWKLPLVTLLFQLPRPPFPFRWWTNTNVFVMMNFVGNPISTIASLLVTLHGCQDRAKGFRERISQIHAQLLPVDPNKAKELQRKADMLWKGFALIQVSCDEWGLESAYAFFKNSLNRLYLQEQDPKRAELVMNFFQETIETLAADRATYILPIVIALFAFIASIGAAYWRIIGSPPEPGLWINVEAYSIAMSAPFLYVVPAVFLGAVIGVSQTERSVPRELNKLRVNLEKEGWFNGNDDNRLFKKIEAKAETSFHRIFHGGMYSWRPDLLLPSRLSTAWPFILLAFLIVFFSIFVASWISYRVPPEGFDCRNTGQAALLGVWLLSLFLDFLLAVIMIRIGYDGKNKVGYWYQITFVKEVVMGISSIMIIMLVQFGIFNRCDCFTLWGKVPIALPEIPEVAKVLMDRIAFEWPVVTFGWIMVEMGFCCLIWWAYQDAFRVYNQEDGVDT
ncbi:hypothetical protein QBC38DRAFT_514847 [Podospora fimiseda]|uniref:Uncharacterized protein n=1 Tax=Podospora fimiseda TaxID=252190 RepID=A0AAN7BJL4_9PEZI|nr:hypothetical protein QBC38DRAFT_514847 [Podospora fimiseda]